MMKKKLGIIIGIFILTAGAAYFASAAGIVFFGDDARLETETFTEVGSSQWIVPAGVNSVELLVVAGGGGGGSSGPGSGGGGGGGAGGLKYISSFSVTPGQSINVTVGDGGAPGESKLSKDGSDGLNSSFDTVTTTGGGGGAKSWGVNGHPGGSGGGGGYNGYNTVRTGGSGVAGQGNAGGNTSMLSWAGGAGGGGAGGVGGDNKINHAGGDRGPGLAYSITGPSVIYAMGGGGGANSPVMSIANTGNGGDAAYAAGTAYAGASGIVVIRYKKPVKTQTASIEKGLIGHWMLDGDSYNSTTNIVTDKTPYGNNGVNTNATLTTDRLGQVNGAMSFNGVDSRIAINYANPIKETSVMAWFKRSGVPAGGYHIITGGTLIELSIPDSNGAVRTGVTTVTQGRKVFNGGSGLNDGQWHQLGLTYDGTSLKSYLDGQVKATNAVSGDLSGVAREIGRLLGPSYVTNGSISDVRIYNRALSSDEVLLLFDSYKPKIVSDSLQKGLIVDMPLNSGWTKTDTAGSQIMTNKTPYDLDGINTGAVISSDSATFDGVSDRAIRTKNSVLLNADQTYSVWINSGPIDGALKGVFTTHNHALTSNIGINEISNRFYISIGYLDGTREYSSKPSNFVIVPNVWTHVVLLYDSVENSVSFYVNGIFDKKWILVKPVKFTSEKVLIGKWSTTYSSYMYNGSISAAKIYDHVLSASEIKTLFDRGRY